MAEFVREQPTAGVGGKTHSRPAEYYVFPDGERRGTDRTGRLHRLIIAVYSDGREVMAETWLEEGS